MTPPKKLGPPGPTRGTKDREKKPQINCVNKKDIQKQTNMKKNQKNCGGPRGEEKKIVKKKKHFTATARDG